MDGIPPMSTNQLQLIEERMGPLGIQWQKGVTGDLRTGCDTLDEVSMEQLHIPPESQQRLSELHHRFCRQWQAGMQQESYRHPPYTTNWTKYGNDVDRMTTIQADDFVLMLKALARSTRDYAFPLCEFQAVNPRYNANTLCLPGVGLSVYQATGQGLLHILRNKNTHKRRKLNTRLMR